MSGHSERERNLLHVTGVENWNQGSTFPVF